MTRKNPKSKIQNPKNFFIGLSGIIIATIIILAFSVSAQTPKPGPVIINKSLSDPSINEPSVKKQAGYKQDVLPQLGKVPADYLWQGIGVAVASLFEPMSADPTWLGYKDDVNKPNSIWDASDYKYGLERLYQDFKKIGGKNITDVPKLGEVCGTKPGDAYWVAKPRPGNIEWPPFYQIWHHQDDCYCRCGEQISCPIPTYAGEINWHRIGGGPALHNISCELCFGYSANIRKHDYFVGKDSGTFPGYPSNKPTDTGYQECLRQSGESYSASGPGGSPKDPTLYGI